METFPLKLKGWFVIAQRAFAGTEGKEHVFVGHPVVGG
jgi:hypothetical protein